MHELGRVLRTRKKLTGILTQGRGQENTPTYAHLGQSLVPIDLYDAFPHRFETHSVSELVTLFGITFTDAIVLHKGFCLVDVCQDSPTVYAVFYYVDSVANPHYGPHEDIVTVVYAFREIPEENAKHVIDSIRADIAEQVDARLARI